MTMQMELSQLIGWAAGLLTFFATVVTALVKLLLTQFEKRLADRFAAQDDARKSASRHWEESFAKLLDRQDKEAEAVKQLERAFMRFQADLPLEYVRREDFVRSQSVIEAKLDGLALKFENVLLKGARHD
jgi:biopolymer transport protein ExbB/TolQ